MLLFGRVIGLRSNQSLTGTSFRLRIMSNLLASLWQC